MWALARGKPTPMRRGIIEDIGGAGRTNDAIGARSHADEQSLSLDGRDRSAASLSTNENATDQKAMAAAVEHSSGFASPEQAAYKNAAFALFSSASSVKSPSSTERKPYSDAGWTPQESSKNLITGIAHPHSTSANSMFIENCVASFQVDSDTCET